MRRCTNLDEKGNQAASRWAGIELDLMEIVVSKETPSQGMAELRSLRGLEDLVACVLAERPLQ